jgi:hypothetical protein
VRIIEHLSESLNNLRQKSTDLLGSTVGHITESLNRGHLRPPIVIIVQRQNELGKLLLDGIVGEVGHNHLKS